MMEIARELELEVQLTNQTELLPSHRKTFLLLFKLEDNCFMLFCQCLIPNSESAIVYTSPSLASSLSPPTHPNPLAVAEYQFRAPCVTQIPTGHPFNIWQSICFQG